MIPKKKNQTNNKKTPLISVIMAVHNSENFLEERILSVLGQSFKDFELILIDDLSTDDSLKITQKYKKKDRRIILLKNKKNLGPAGTRNEGLKKARGKYIAILDSDDLSHPERLKRQFNYLEEHPDIFLVGSSAIFIDEEGREIRRFRKYMNPELLSWRLPKSCSIIHSSIMFRNGQNMFYNEEYKYAHDYAFYLEALSRNKELINVPDFLVKYRVSGDSISVKKRREQVYFRNLIMRRYSFLNKRSLYAIKKIYFSLFLFFFYLRTFLEKRNLRK